MLSFEEIAKNIIDNNKYKNLKKENHHGISRYDHSLRVARITYKISKYFNKDYVSATRAALLHDFFIDTDFKYENTFDKSKNHAEVALKNSEEHFKLNEIEKEAILSHMFPLNRKLPSSAESFILNITDKMVAIYECTRFKLNRSISVWVLFIFNLITFTNN